MNTGHDILRNDLDALSRKLAQIAQTDGDFSTAIPGLMIYRRSAATVPMPSVYGLGLGITVQGAKRVLLGDQVFDYGPGQSLLTSIDLPLAAYVTQGSAAAPYFGIRIDFEPEAITKYAREAIFAAPNSIPTARAMSVLTLDVELLDAVARLTRLLDEPKLIPIIAPLIEQEIIIRLLMGQHGTTLRHLIAMDSPGQQIAKIIAWLKKHCTENILMDDLAEKAHMSPSTFRQHFRAFTGMSPLQYSKQLRLQGARQMMLNQDIDANSAATRSGYESVSQFSREYRRLFGEPPHRDIKRIREILSAGV
ncbi:AraC-like DNA-binding protein [Oxalobacteraceae bacterium GrIS 1.11]